MPRQAVEFDDLIGDIGLERFIAENWGPELPYVNTDTVKILGSFAGIEQLGDSKGLIAGYSDKISLLSRGRGARDVDSAEAVEAIDDGWTVYLRRVDGYIPELNGVLEDMGDKLGIQREYLACEAFMSEGHSGAAMHSDYDVNFALLVRGMKKWRISPNTTIKNPPSIVLPHGLKQTRQVSEVLGDSKLPDKMPDDADEYVMNSGNLLFLPRGWWHETESTGSCLQINFVVKGPQLSEFITNGIKRILELRDDNRAFVSRINTKDGLDALKGNTIRALIDLGVIDDDAAEHIASLIISAQTDSDTAAS